MAYEQVVFIDAHANAHGWEPIHWQEIDPTNRSSAVTHRMGPNDIAGSLCIAV